MAAECDLVAMREIVPAATMKLPLVGEHAGRDVTLCTVLPLALPCLTRSQGSVLVAMRASAASPGSAGRTIPAPNCIAFPDTSCGRAMSKRIWAFRSVN